MKKGLLKGILIGAAGVALTVLGAKVASKKEDAAVEGECVECDYEEVETSDSADEE